MMLVYKIINRHPILVKLHLIKKTKELRNQKQSAGHSAIPETLLPPGNSKPQGQTVGA